MGGARAFPKAAHLERLRLVAKRWGGEDLCELTDGRPSFLWLFGSTMVEAVAEADGTVQVRAFLVIRPNPHPELPREVARVCGRVPIGRLVIDQDGDITLTHTIPPGRGVEQMDREVHQLCCWADRLDDELCRKLGGMRSWDLFQADVLNALAGGERPLVPAN